MKKLFCVIAASVLVTSGHAAKWGYKGDIGPSHWANLDPSFQLCALGKQQSPIDIKIKHIKAANENFAINYQTAKTLTIADKQYLLQEIHFHTPSETRLQGVSTPAEIHFIYHFINGGAHDELAVIAVFVKVGEANPVLEPLINNMSALAIAKLINTSGGAYQYQGSLTTPPCTEGVTWLVMKEPITASSQQIVRMRKADHGANARPVQPLNKRSIVFITGKTE